MVVAGFVLRASVGLVGLSGIGVLLEVEDLVSGLLVVGIRGASVCKRVPWDGVFSGNVVISGKIVVISGSNVVRSAETNGSNIKQ